MRRLTSKSLRQQHNIMRVKYNNGGGIDPTKLSPEARKRLIAQLQAELAAAKSSRYASVEDKNRDVQSLTRRLNEAQGAGGVKQQPQKQD